MRQANIHLKYSRYTALIAVAVVAVAAVSAIALIHHASRGVAAATPPKKSKVRNPASIPSEFSFAGTAGWIQGPTNNTSMALFHATSISQPASDGCFASAEYHAGTVNVAVELQKNQTTLSSTGHTVSLAGTQNLALQTGAGPIQYQLQQYNLGGSDNAGRIMEGQEFGYAQLSGGYVKLMAYCNTADELTATIPALQAFKFDGVSKKP